MHRKLQVHNVLFFNQLNNRWIKLIEQCIILDVYLCFNLKLRALYSNLAYSFGFSSLKFFRLLNRDRLSSTLGCVATCETKVILFSVASRVGTKRPWDFRIDDIHPTKAYFLLCRTHCVWPGEARRLKSTWQKMTLTCWMCVIMWVGWFEDKYLSTFNIAASS